MGMTFIRKLYQRLQIGEAIVTVQHVERRRIKLHIEAPPAVLLRALEAESEPGAPEERTKDFRPHWSRPPRRPH
jgi:hypothetical protein